MTLMLCHFRTTTTLGTGADVAMTHEGAGVWSSVHESSVLASLLPASGRVDAVLTVPGAAQRLVARYRVVTLLDDRPAL